MLNKRLAKSSLKLSEFNYKFSCFLSCFEISLKCSESPSGMWYEGQGGVELKTTKKCTINQCQLFRNLRRVFGLLLVIIKPLLISWPVYVSHWVTCEVMWRWEWDDSTAERPRRVTASHLMKLNGSRPGSFDWVIVLVC